MRSFTTLRNTVNRQASRAAPARAAPPRDTVKPTINKIDISAPRPSIPIPEIVVTPPPESSEWELRVALPKCVLTRSIRGADNCIEEVSILPHSRRAWRSTRTIRPSPSPPAPAPSPAPSARSAKRNAVGNFAQILARATDPAEDFARYREVMRREIWGGVEISLPADGVFTVVVPGSSTSRKEFKFGKGMQYEDMYRHFIAYLSDETNRKSPAPMVFVSRTYTDAIYDAKSYKAWLTWMKEQDASDRILMVV